MVARHRPTPLAFRDGDIRISETTITEALQYIADGWLGRNYGLPHALAWRRLRKLGHLRDYESDDGLVKFYKITKKGERELAARQESPPGLRLSTRRRKAARVQKA